MTRSVPPGVGVAAVDHAVAAGIMASAVAARTTIVTAPPSQNFVERMSVLALSSPSRVERTWGLVI
jgi:anti-sigma factor RsiW